MCRYVKVWHIGFLCASSSKQASNEYWRREKRRRMQKERRRRERPTRHSHYLIHGTPSQPSDKSSARWDGVLKADERKREREIQKALNHEVEGGERRTLFQTQFKKDVGLMS